MKRLQGYIKDKKKRKRTDDLCLRSRVELRAVVRRLATLTYRDNRFHAKCHGGHCSGVPPPRAASRPLAFLVLWHLYALTLPANEKCIAQY